MKSLHRITRNDLIFLAVFDKNSSLSLKRVWSLSVSAVLEEAIRQMERQKANAAHVNLDETFARNNGNLVFVSQEN